MSWKKTITAGISALAISGVQLGAGLTSTAQAATPTTPTAAGDVVAQYSRNFRVKNLLNDRDGDFTLELAGVYGQTEGQPPIGSTLAVGDEQDFEVQWAFWQDRVFVTYKVHQTFYGRQTYRGDIPLQLTVDGSGKVSSRLSANTNPYPMHLAGGVTSPWIVFG
jgi:hypothetical protein